MLIRMHSSHSVAGAFVTAKTAAKFWRDRNMQGCSLVMIASMSGEIANRGLTCSAYNSSKAAVHQMCRSLAQEWGPAYGIRINTLSPGVSLRSFSCRSSHFVQILTFLLLPPTVHSDGHDGRAPR